MIAGTEVFHDQCVAAGLVENSVGAKQKRRIIQLASAVEREHKLRTEERHQRDTRIEKLQSEMRAVRDQHTQNLSELERVRTTLKNAVEHSGLYHDQRNELARRVNAQDAELQALRAERDRLAQELALEKALTKAEAALPKSVEKDDRDGTEVRFGLLELD